MSVETSDTSLNEVGNLLGYKVMPPTIDEFLDNEYYLGGHVKVFPYWREHLREIFPNPLIVKHPFIALAGPLGVGKSLFSIICSLYTYCKVDHLENLDYFGITFLKGIMFGYWNHRVASAYSDLIGPANHLMELSPYFSEGLNNDYDIQLIGDGLRTNNLIGKDVLFYTFTEINFADYDKVSSRITDALTRWSSRFIKVINLFGCFILDSSPNYYLQNLLEDYVKAGNPKFFYVNDPIWVVKAHTKIYGVKGYFKVFLGNDEITERILDDGYDKSLYDEDNILSVPRELYDTFATDIEQALRDNAGITISSSNTFIKRKDLLENCFTLPQKCPELIEVGFFTHDEHIYPLVKNAVAELDITLPLYIRIDLGLTNDLTGLAITQFKEYKYNKDLNKYLDPSFKVPVIFGIGRRIGEETPIMKIRDFILKLASLGYQINCVSTDSYQSSQLRQELLQFGIHSIRLSVDISTEPYRTVKGFIYQGRVDFAQSNTLKRELLMLQDYMTKIDHLPNESKDYSDAVIGGIITCNDDIVNSSKSTKRNFDNSGYNFMKNLVASQTEKNLDFEADFDTMKQKYRTFHE